MSVTFWSNVGCFSTDLPDLGVACSDLPFLTGLCALVTMIAALIASIAACVFAHVMLSSATIFYCGFLETAFVSLYVSLSSVS